MSELSIWPAPEMKSFRGGIHQLPGCNHLRHLPFPDPLNESDSLARFDMGNLGAFPRPPVALDDKVDLLAVPADDILELGCQLGVLDCRVESG